MRKNEKGITIIALVMTLMVLGLITVPTVVNTGRIRKFNDYKELKDDIDNLRETIQVAFYSDSINNIGPKVPQSMLAFLNDQQGDQPVKNTNDNDTYYAIKIEAVNIRVTSRLRELNYGTENSKITTGEGEYAGSDDVYIINEQSRTIYYVKGVTYDGITYHRLAEDFTEINLGTAPGITVTDINQTYTDKDGATAKIPVGFKVSEIPSEQTVKDGLVIKDDEGNEFVWIPVQEIKYEEGKEIDYEFSRYDYGEQVKNGIEENSNSSKIFNGSNDSTYFYEGLNNLEMKSVIDNKGFYIGRYEAGSTYTRNASSPADKPIVQKNANVYNFVTKTEADTISSSFISSENLNSKLCSSYAWDTVLKFIEDTGSGDYLVDSSEGNYDTILKNTGTTTAVKNIYDLGGNAYEWTSESSSDAKASSVVRGGAIGKTAESEPASTRTALADTKSENTGFRIALFLTE